MPAKALATEGYLIPDTCHLRVSVLLLRARFAARGDSIESGELGGDTFVALLLHPALERSV